MVLRISRNFPELTALQYLLGSPGFTLQNLMGSRATGASWRDRSRPQGVQGSGGTEAISTLLEDPASLMGPHGTTDVAYVCDLRGRGTLDGVLVCT